MSECVSQSVEIWSFVVLTGEVLPHSMGEMMLILVGVGPVKSGYSPSCTHSFITSGALSEPLLAHYPVRSIH